MYFGWPSPCLCVRDLDRSRQFYEALGMEVLPEVSAPGERVVLRSGVLRLALFRDIGTDLLNFRGADVRAVHAAPTRRFPALAGEEPASYTPADVEKKADLAGCCWATRDPDGRAILFDTNVGEEGEAGRRRRAGQVLRDAERELAALGVDAESRESLRELAARIESRGGTAGG